MIKILLILLGIASAVTGVKGFLAPNHFIDGGVTGSSMLAAIITQWKIGLFVLLFNIPFFLLGMKEMSRQFSIRSILIVTGFALTLALTPEFTITNDKLLSAVFGGILLGAGIGLTIRGGGVLDGSEILALLISRRTSLSIGRIILLFNICLFTIASFFIGREAALYSVLTYFAASKTIDFVIYGIEEYIGVTIISKKSASIREYIIHQFNKGITTYQTKGGMSEEKQDTLFCVITRLELPILKKNIARMDPNAVLIVSPVKEMSGGIIQKRSHEKLI